MSLFRLLPVLAILLYNSVSKISCTADPCSSYRSIHETERRYVFYQADKHNRETTVCDKYLIPGWYRLRNDDIPSTAPPLTSCGTTHPVWLSGDIPNDADGIVNRTACRHDNADTCSHGYEIQIKSCGTYRVYNLTPTLTCDEAYCFGSGTDGPAPTYVARNVIVTPKIVPKILQNGFALPELQFSCDFTPSITEALYYQIYWFKKYDHERYWQYTKTALLEEHLNQTHFLEDEIGQLNETIRCGVRTKYAVDGRLSSLTRSEEFYAGLQVLTPLVTVDSLGTTNITVQSTVPFGCFPVTSICVLYLELHFPSSCNVAQTVISNAQYCGLRLASDKWNSLYNITVNAHSVRRPGDYAVHFRTIQNLGHPIWSDVEVGPIQVVVPNLSKSTIGIRTSGQDMCTCPYSDEIIPPLPPAPTVYCDNDHVVSCQLRHSN